MRPIVDRAGNKRRFIGLTPEEWAKVQRYHKVQRAFRRSRRFLTVSILVSIALLIAGPIFVASQQYTQRTDRELKVLAYPLRQGLFVEQPNIRGSRILIQVTEDRSFEQTLGLVDREVRVDVRATFSVDTSAPEYDEAEEMRWFVGVSTGINSYMEHVDDGDVRQTPERPPGVTVKPKVSSFPGGVTPDRSVIEIHAVFWTDAPVTTQGRTADGWFQNWSIVWDGEGFAGRTGSVWTYVDDSDDVGNSSPSSGAVPAAQEGNVLPPPAEIRICPECYITEAYGDAQENAQLDFGVIGDVRSEVAFNGSTPWMPWAGLETWYWILAAAFVGELVAFVVSVLGERRQDALLASST
jgi:hypothetical protein